MISQKRGQSHEVRSKEIEQSLDGERKKEPRPVTDDGDVSLFGEMYSIPV